MIMSKKLLCYSTLTIIAAVVFLKSYWTENSPVCVKNYENENALCSLICPNGSFVLPGMTTCHPWLKCGAKIRIVSTIFHSVVKTIYLANWQGYNVIVSALTSDQFKEDFKQNLVMLKSIGPHPFVTQLIGYCENYFVTQYYKMGHALNLNYHLNHSINYKDNIKVRLRLCVNYVSILQYLHNSPVGRRVMCDTNSLEKTLTQYLLTDDLKLIVNDLDATPLVSDTGVICGPNELSGSFIAPEQLWPFSGQKYDASQMVGYNEKTDIWKIPDVCNWFLGDSPEADVVKYKLFHIHKRCKNKNSFMRPDAEDVVKAYKSVLQEIKQT